MIFTGLKIYHGAEIKVSIQVSPDGVLESIKCEHDEELSHNLTVLQQCIAGLCLRLQKELGR